MTGRRISSLTMTSRRRRRSKGRQRRNRRVKRRTRRSRFLKEKRNNIVSFYIINVYNNYFGYGSKNNVFIGNECYSNIFEGGFINNTFVSSCHNNYFQFNTFNNNFKYQVIYLTGSFNNLNFIDNTYTSLDIDKQISKVDEGYVISYLDPDTLTLQVCNL